MKLNSTDCLTFFLIVLCIVPVTTKNTPSVSVPPTMSWATKTSATKRKVIMSAEEINTPTAKSCPLKKGVLELGKIILLDDCGRLECVEETAGLLTLAEVRCRPPHEQLSLECQWTQKAVLRFPDCCVAAITCERSRKPFGEAAPSDVNVTKIAFQTKPSTSMYRILPHKPSMLEPMHSASSNVNVLVVDRNNRGNGTFRNNLMRKKDSKTDVLYINNPTTTGPTSKKSARSKTRGYDYKKFIEKAKNLFKTTNSSEPKPSFFLPSRRRKTPSTETIDPPQVTRVIFVTNDTTSQPTVQPQESKIQDTIYERRRLSSLLSDQTLKGRLAEKFVPIIAATSEQQKSFLFSKIIRKPDNDSTAENSNQKNITSSTEPPKTRSRKPHWHLDSQKQGRMLGNFENRRKLFSSRLHRFMNKKPEKNETNENSTMPQEAQEVDQTSTGSTDILGTVETVVNFSVDSKLDSVLTKNLDDGNNKIEKKGTDNESGTQVGMNSRTKTRERIKMRRKKMPIPTFGNVRDKRLLEMLSYESKRKNSTDDETEKPPNEFFTTEIPSLESSSANPTEVLVNSTPQTNLAYHQRRRIGPKERLFLHIKPINRTKSRIVVGPKIVERKKDLNDTLTVAMNASETKLETATETVKVNRSRTFNKVSIPVFRLQDLKSEENKATPSRGKLVFDLSRRKRLNNLINSPELSEIKVTSRGRKPQIEQSKDSNDIQKISENEIDSTKITETTPPSASYLEEEDYVLLEEPPPGYDPTTDPDYPPLTPIKSSLEDFDRHYPLPDEDNHRKFYDLDLSSSDADISKLLGQEENEIHDEDTKIPMKVTTVVISQSQKSYRSSVSRDTAKNFKETPIYESKMYYKNVKKPVPQA